jgi:NADPH:quinone reductase-like Zn-dependent oxidoreductase
VFGYAQGTYAETVAASFKTLLPMPENLGFEQAAIVALYVITREIRVWALADGKGRTYTTSYEGLTGRGQAKAGE